MENNGSAMLPSKHLTPEGFQPSITMLNMSGDITITWDESNRDKILALIKKKMSEGYVFFTSKTIPLIEMTKKTKVTNKNLSKCDSILIDDATFDKMIASVDDKDLVDAVLGGSASFAKPAKNKAKNHVIERDPEKIADSQSLGVRRIAGG